MRRVHLAEPGLADVDVPVAPSAGALREPPAAGPLRLAAHRALGDLLALDLRDKPTRRDNELAGRRVLEVLGRELETHAGGLGLVEQHSDVVLIRERRSSA